MAFGGVVVVVGFWKFVLSNGNEGRNNDFRSPALIQASCKQQKGVTEKLVYLICWTGGVENRLYPQSENAIQTFSRSPSFFWSHVADGYHILEDLAMQRLLLQDATIFQHQFSSKPVELIGSHILLAFPAPKAACSFLRPTLMSTLGNRNSIASAYRVLVNRHCNHALGDRIGPDPKIVDWDSCQVECFKPSGFHGYWCTHFTPEIKGDSWEARWWDHPLGLYTSHRSFAACCCAHGRFESIFLTDEDRHCLISGPLAVMFMQS